MAFPQIGLDAVLKIDQFEKNARTYNRTLDGMEKKTKQTSNALNKSTQRAANSAFDLTKGFREAAGGVDDMATSAGSAAVDITASFGSIAAAAGIVTAGIGGTIAALDKLLEAGEEAAALEDIRQSFLALAASSGVSASKLVSDLQSISRGTISTVESIKIANEALLLGGGAFASELPRIFEIAAASARATGDDFGQVVGDLVRGIARGSPELINNANILIKSGQVYEDYAASIGVAVADLTEHDKVQATLNATLESGGKFLASLGDDVTSATDPFKQLKVQSESFGTGLKTLVAPAAEALAKSLQGLIFGAKATIAIFVALNSVGQVLKRDFTKAGDSIDLFRTEFDRVFKTLDTGIKPIEDIESGITGIGDASTESAAKVGELDTKLADLATQRGERLAKIELQNARRDEDIAIQRGRQLEDADRQIGRQREDSERNSARARERISRDNAKRIADVEKDNRNKRRALVQESQRERESQERVHRENLFQINQKSDDVIGEAARRNDAVAIAQELRQKQREIRDEQRGSQIEKQDLSRNLQEKQQRLDEDATLSLEKARQQSAQALADQQASETQQEESLKLSLQRQEGDRNLAHTRQNEDLLRARERQLEDLDSWYASEQEKLDANLKKQTEIAVAGVQKSGVAIAQAATRAISTVATSTIGLSSEEQRRQRGNFLGSESPVSSIGLSEEEQRRLRGSFLRRAEGGIDVVNRPTAFLAGEAGPEIAAFIPLRDTNLNIGGSVGVDVKGAGGMDTGAIQQIVYAAMEIVAKRISVTR